jgi:hypothetical protein
MRETDLTNKNMLEKMRETDLTNKNMLEKMRETDLTNKNMLEKMRETDLTNKNMLAKGKQFVLIRYVFNTNYINIIDTFYRSSSFDLLFMFCRSLFVQLAITLSVLLRFTDS